MASISDLPTELLLTIFKLIYDKDIQTISSGDDDIVEGGYSEHSSAWAEDDLHSQTLFPMAVAYVCRLWRDALARSPEYWKRVVFEVGRDPTPMLDAFSWSNGQLLDVLIWSRSPDLTLSGKALENERVSAITQSFTPHFHRCSRISYEVTYASSLPSIATLFQANPSILTHFVFQSRVDDMQYDRSNSLSIAMMVGPNMPIVVPFSDLLVLSLGARLFIDLGRTYPSWLHNFRSKSHLTLTISQFRFQHGNDNEQYSLAELLSHLATMPQPEALRLRNLSLAYEPKMPSDLSFFIKSTSLFFDNLGENFLSEFFTRTRLMCDNVYVNRCTFPWIDRFALTSGHLHLENLGYIHNMHNILGVWQGRRLSLDSCAAFDDDLVDRLNEDGANTYLNLLTVLTVKDCFNFTSAGLRNLMTIQKAIVVYDDNEQMILDRVSVEGGRLSLSEEDISWFRQQRGETNVSWTIIHPDGTYAYPLNHYHDTLG